MGLVLASDLRDRAIASLQLAWQEWVASLPEDAAERWIRGAAYIRESSMSSLVSDAPRSQLVNTLAMLARESVYVPWEGVFFEQASGASVDRAVLNRLRELAIAGHFKVVGAFVSERLFRNMEQAIEVKREFRKHDIRLLYLGKFEGDERNPATWQLERSQEINDELYARKIGYHIGTNLEVRSRAGYPVGQLPEGYCIGERSASWNGRRGTPLTYEPSEPMATIIRAGFERFLAGASLTDLAAWSATQLTDGMTPRGATMNSWWWRSTLWNPKYAGYHKPTAYQGYKPGVESPSRERRTKSSELVPCKLPPLWTLEEHRQVIATAEHRYHQPRHRAKYRDYILTGIAVSSSCGHRMTVHSKEKSGTYRMHCGRLTPTGRHGPILRANPADAELDALIGSISFEDHELLAMIEDELEQLAARETNAKERFAPDPAIGQIKRSLAALPDGFEDVRKQLTERIADLAAADEVRREQISQPLLMFRASVDRLRDWEAVWHGASIRQKNELLREAKVQVEIGPIDGEPRMAHLLGISSEVPAFGLALAAALAKRGQAVGFDGPPLYGPSNPNEVVIRVESPLAGVASMTGLAMRNDSVIVHVERRSEQQKRKKQPRRKLARPAEDGPLMSVSEFARAVGQTARQVRNHIDKGRIRILRRAPDDPRVWIPRSQLESVPAIRRRGRPSRDAVGERINIGEVA